MVNQINSKVVSVIDLKYMHNSGAGWSSLVARRAHNPKVVGSNPAPATTFLYSESGRQKFKIQVISKILSYILSIKVVSYSLNSAP